MEWMYITVLLFYYKFHNLRIFNELIKEINVVQMLLKFKNYIDNINIIIDVRDAYIVINVYC